MEEQIPNQSEEEQKFSEAEKYKNLENSVSEITPPSSVRNLKELRRPGKGVRTSDGILFGGPEDVWGRDTAITAEDLINIDPETTEEAIISLAAYQGVNTDKTIGEKPGRIHTEHREIWKNKQLPILDFKNFIESKAFLATVSTLLWQRRLKGVLEYTNYFSMDTTPLYIRTISEYAKANPKILDKEVKKKDGTTETIKESAVKAAEYVVGTVSGDGLIRIKEENLFGNQYRYWRDSPNSYRDEKGQTPNITEEMVILDIQGLSVEALDDAADLVDTEDPEKANSWREIANQIRKATIDKLWDEDEQYFNFALHTDKETHEMVPLKTMQSNAGWLLNSSFFEGLSSEEKQKYVGGIIKTLFSNEFLTDAGIRCRAKKHMEDQDFADYHGAWVSWPMETYMIAKGLRRQGFERLADQLETRIINATNLSGVNYEFFVIDPEGKIILNPQKTQEEAGSGDKSIDIEMKPEHTIAWTVTASLRLKKERSERWRKEHVIKEKPSEQEEWITNLEDQILLEIGESPVYKTRKEIAENKITESDMYIDRPAGLKKASANLNEVLTPVLKRRIKKRLWPFSKNKKEAE